MRGRGLRGGSPLWRMLELKRGRLVSSCGEEGKRGIYEWLTEWDGGM